jgi:hypothetical protein
VLQQEKVQLAGRTSGCLDLRKFMLLFNGVDFRTEENSSKVLSPVSLVVRRGHASSVHALAPMLFFTL